MHAVGRDQFSDHWPRMPGSKRFCGRSQGLAQSCASAGVTSTGVGAMWSGMVGATNAVERSVVLVPELLEAAGDGGRLVRRLGEQLQRLLLHPAPDRQVDDRLGSGEAVRQIGSCSGSCAGRPLQAEQQLVVGRTRLRGGPVGHCRSRCRAGRRCPAPAGTGSPPDTSGPRTTRGRRPSSGSRPRRWCKGSGPARRRTAPKGGCVRRRPWRGSRRASGRSDPMPCPP